MVSIAIGVLLTPIILGTLGSQLFGIWALLNTVTAYESISDLGIPTAMVWFVNKSRSNETKNQLITAGVLANTATTLVAVLLLVVLRDPIIRLLFKVPVDLLPATELAYTLTLVAMVLMVLARSFSAVLDAFQRVDLRFAVDTVGTLAWAGILWIFLRRGFGLGGVVGATVIVGGLRALAMAISMLRVYPPFRLRLRLARSTLSGIVHYGIRVQGASLGQSLSDPLLKGLTGVGLTAVEVGAVQVGASAASVPNSLAFSMIGYLFPAIAERHGAGDLAGVRKMASHNLLYVVIFVLPVSVFLLCSAPVLVRLWLHDSYPLIVASLRLLTFAYVFRALGMVPWYVSWGLGHPQDNSVAMIAQVSLLAGGGAALLLLSRFSYTGILAVYIGSMAASTVYLTWCMARRLPGFFSVDNPWLFGSVLRVLLISLLASVPYLLIGRTGIASSWTLLLADAAILVLSYAAAFALAIPEAERDTLKQLLQRPVRRLQHLTGIGRTVAEDTTVSSDEHLEET